MRFTECQTKPSLLFLPILHNILTKLSPRESTAREEWRGGHTSHGGCNHWIQTKVCVVAGAVMKQHTTPRGRRAHRKLQFSHLKNELLVRSFYGQKFPCEQFDYFTPTLIMYIFNYFEIKLNTFQIFFLFSKFS